MCCLSLRSSVYVRVLPQDEEAGVMPCWMVSVHAVKVHV